MTATDQVSRALVKAIDAWLKERPESVKYPGPGDEGPLHKMLEAHEALKLALKR